MKTNNGLITTGKYFCPVIQKYIDQLLEDIVLATENGILCFKDKPDIFNWVPDEEESNTAPERDLEEWTGIKKDMLPPAEMLNEVQLKALLAAMIKMLDAYNCLFVLQIQTPESLQYECIRLNFDQRVKVKQWHMGFFDLCKEGTDHYKCALGAFCNCGLFAELFGFCG